MEITPPLDADLEAIAVLAADLQAEGDHHIGYLGTTVTSIVTDVGNVDRWTERTVVARVDGEVVGWLLAEKDDDMSRVWWWGPFCADRGDRDVVADQMYRVVAAAVDAREEELAPDERNRWVAGCASRWGFTGETASAVLRYDGGPLGSHSSVVAVGPQHFDDVVALHDRLFPGTHTPGRVLAASDDLRLVYVENGEVRGYVAAAVQSDRAGYIDYLGVDPLHRGRGIGRALVRTAADRLLELGSTSVNLTVRQTNMVARGLYHSLGFTEERMIRPYRKGFSLEG